METVSQHNSDVGKVASGAVMTIQQGLAAVLSINCTTKCRMLKQIKTLFKQLKLNGLPFLQKYTLFCVVMINNGITFCSVGLCCVQTRDIDCKTMLI